MDNTPRSVWALQIIAGAVLAWAAATKFMGSEGNVYIFEVLAMEPTGRYLIGAIELAAAAMLLSDGFAAVGALLGFGTMCGAVIAHVSILGVNVQGDGGVHIALLLLVISCTAAVLVLKRKSLPLIGSTL